MKRKEKKTYVFFSFSPKYSLTRVPMICWGDLVVLMKGRMYEPWVFSA